ncbi:TIGR03087 family PEP-CTERM/XrtA system glycosyltransferase [Parasphingorhabdus sp.]|uniref:TIGR03087 family PEP-CTERM/XrtA system glycosyltransferase n=1 Tax=Parasphingorhabdus sp. TaxID=2709688 RepID=UPI003D2E4072
MEEILFLTHRVPWPPNRGDKIRSHHILRKLMKYTDVHLACFADDFSERDLDSDVKTDLASFKPVLRSKPKWVAGIEALVSQKPVSLTSFDDAEIRTFVAHTLAHRPIACIFVFSGQMAQYIPDDYNGRVVMDFVDVDSAKFESYAADGSGPMAWINHREGRLLKTFESNVAARSDCCLFVSEAEASLFRTRAASSAEKIVAVGNGIDLDFYDSKAVKIESPERDGSLLVFTGQMDYQPNVQAVTSFSKQVMPEILKIHPGAKFAIVGRAPSSDVKALDGANGTAVIGSVDDIRSWIIAADIVVAPLRIARGIQNKVLEAMAMGKPVVASAAAAEGIEAQDGQDFLVANRIEDEAQIICDLLADNGRMTELGKNARSLIRSSYTWDRQLAELPFICGLEPQDMAEAAE